MKSKWVFVQEKALSKSEVTYWYKLLHQITKIGIEFEFNLKNATGLCPTDLDTAQGPNFSKASLTTKCPCSVSDKYSCSKRCVHQEPCSKLPVRSRCQKNKDGSCKLSDYPTCSPSCERWEFSCLETNCVDFEAPCNHGCIYFKKDCVNCIESMYNKNSPSQVRERARHHFKPIKSFEKISSSGVFDITEDGSLLGDKGIEVITTGRRFNYSAFGPMVKEIIDYCKENNAYVNQRCGLHIHTLASWLSKDKSSPFGGMRENASEYSELERPMPDVILANMHQLYRRYSAAIVWLTSTGNSKDHLTRWVKFRKPILKYSPITSSMYNIIVQMKKDIDSYKNEEVGKYAMVNYIWTKFSEDPNFISRFHVEFRVADGNLSATATMAIIALHWAILMKAVRLSRWGLIEAFNNEKGQMQALVLGSLLNNNNENNNRQSDTSSFFRNGYDDITIKDSLELIRLLKSELIGCGNSYEVLKALATKPMSLRLCEGDSWDKIENDLSSRQESLDELDEKIELSLELGEFSGRQLTKEQYVQELFSYLDGEYHVSLLESSIAKLTGLGRIIWNEKLGAYSYHER